MEMDELKTRVRRYVIGKLAQQLYDCVECHTNPRAESDWLTAERFLDAHPYIISSFVSYLAGTSPEWMTCLMAKETIRMQVQRALQDDVFIDQLLGRKVWDRGYQLLKHQLPRPPYGRILFQ